MSRRTSARLASKSFLHKRPFQLDDNLTDDDISIANDTEFDDEYIPYNSRKKRQSPRKKRAKFPRKFDPSLLPNELLHCIFQHSEPRMLGKLMLVCKKFEYVLRMDESVRHRALMEVDSRSGGKPESAGFQVSLLKTRKLVRIFKPILLTNCPSACLNRKSFPLLVFL